MPFMEKQITGKQTWIELDGNAGVTALPVDVLTKEEYQIAESVDGDGNAESEDLTAHFGEYYEGTKVYTVTVREGYGARLSAPGYMDCTEWAVFDTEEEAREYLEENYPDDEEDSDAGEYEFDTLADCKASGRHLSTCDDDGYCNLCGEQE